MILVRTVIIVLPEKKKEVFQTLLSLITPHGEGCLNYEIFNNIENGNVFNLISEWDTRIILPLTDAREASEIAEQMRTEMVKPLPGGGTVTVSVSVGVAACRKNHQRYQNFVRKTDAALYQAKRNGKNWVVVGEAD